MARTRRPKQQRRRKAVTRIEGPDGMIRVRNPEFDLMTSLHSGPWRSAKAYNRRVKHKSRDDD